MFRLKCKASFSEAKTKIRSNIKKLGIILDFLSLFCRQFGSVCGFVILPFCLANVPQVTDSTSSS